MACSVSLSKRKCGLIRWGYGHWAEAQRYGQGRGLRQRACWRTSPTSLPRRNYDEDGKKIAFFADAFLLQSRDRRSLNSGWASRLRPPLPSTPGWTRSRSGRWEPSISRCGPPQPH